MAVLLVGITIMSIMLSVAMPVWHQQVQREREAELIFRGEQYAHAIVLFQHKYGATLPPNIDVLIDQKFLRKKYKDPITGGDFQPIYQAAPAQAGTARPGQTTGSAPPTGSTPPAGDAAGTMPHGGLVGVVSKSKAKSIRLYNGFDHYNQWAFVYTQVTQAPSPITPAKPGQPGQPAGAARPGMPMPSRPSGSGPGGH